MTTAYNLNGFHQPDAPPLLIEAHNLAKSFGDFAAVKNVSLRVGAGEILALLGHNGAGKTTTTRMLAAILAPTSGYARIAGYDTVTQPLEVRRTIGHLTEQPGLYNRMRVIDYLEFFGELQEVPKKLLHERSEELLHRFDLWDTRNLRLGEYSKGMRQKAALIRALIHEPQVLFLDEPTSAMDPYSAKIVRDAIADLKQHNRSIILCTHNLVEAEVLADRIAIIRKGEIIIEGTSEELKQKLLGDPHYKVELNRPFEQVPSQVLALPGLQLIEQTANSFTYQTSEPQVQNPLVLRFLAENGLAVVTLSQVSRSLETVYLKIAGTPISGGQNRDEIEQSLLKDKGQERQEVLQ
ncbi:MAG TPA: ABC transporter ATP-binding protein [Chloroflexia bacterium]|nr:ABC transporter ATP-binding protein [Chloroflexia bacterium]